MHAQAEGIKAKFDALRPMLDERTRRLWAAAEAKAIGWGGISRVAEATGMSHGTVRSGLRELAAGRPEAEPRRRVRRPGGGRKRLTERDPELASALERKLGPVTRGDPMAPLRWTCSSAARLAEELRAEGHGVSERTVNRLLHGLGYSLQANRKTLERKRHPDREAQFGHISRRVQEFQQRGNPVVSVACHRRELAGQYRDAVREWRRKGNPEEVQAYYDFAAPKLGRPIPYGAHDVTPDASWVSVGTDHGTAEFAVETLRRWWREMGRSAYPKAGALLVTADGGGSGSSRSRLWKLELQGLADESGLEVSVCHFPAGTSKWTQIEHRMFCHVTQNWSGRPLVSREVVVELIGPVRTKSGLTIRPERDGNGYATGRKVTREEIRDLSLKRDEFHGEWNYTLAPRPRI